MRSRLARSLAVPAAIYLAAVASSAQTPAPLPGQKRVAPCDPQYEIEFLSPAPAEEAPLIHGASPMPDSMHVILELSADGRNRAPKIFEATFLPSLGSTAVPPTDLNGDATLGDRHPAIPQLILTMDDALMFGGVVLPPGTNLASFVEIIGSEIEHGGDQSTVISWIIDPTFMVIDVNGDLGTNLFAKVGPATDTVFVLHGVDPLYGGFLSTQNPTISIFTPDWISTVDDEVMSDMQTPWTVAVEVRIPCWFNPATSPPTPTPLDPIFGPCQGGTMACTGNFGPVPGPGFHPMFPSLDVRFSDDYIDGMGTGVPGGIITGGQCGVIWGSTGASLGYAFRQASVHAWYGVNGFPDTTPLGGGDDQLIYRFVMPVDGMIIDSDVMPGEMMITAAVEASSNCFSITNVRVKHRPDVLTRNP